MNEYRLKVVIAILSNIRSRQDCFQLTNWFFIDSNQRAFAQIASQIQSIPGQFHNENKRVALRYCTIDIAKQIMTNSPHSQEFHSILLGGDVFRQSQYFLYQDIIGTLIEIENISVSTSNLFARSIVNL